MGELDEFRIHCKTAVHISLTESPRNGRLKCHQTATGICPGPGARRIDSGAADEITMSRRASTIFAYERGRTQNTCQGNNDGDERPARDALSRARVRPCDNPQRDVFSWNSTSKQPTFSDPGRYRQRAIHQFNPLII